MGGWSLEKLGEGVLVRFIFFSMKAATELEGGLVSAFGPSVIWGGGVTGHFSWRTFPFWFIVS